MQPAGGGLHGKKYRYSTQLPVPFPLGAHVRIDVFVSSYCSDFSSIMVPLQSSLTVTLPIGHGSNQPNHNPFPGEQPTIIKFEDKVRKVWHYYVLPYMYYMCSYIAYINLFLV